MKRLAFLLLFPLLLWAQAPVPAQAPTPAPQAPQLTIESIFAPGGLTGREPESIKWSPDGRKVAFVQRDAAGERGELWYVDTAGERAVLVAAEKLSTLVPPPSKVRDERERERLSRYSVAGYHWSPDSRRLLFDALGQLWVFDLQMGVGVQVAASTSGVLDPKWSPDGQRISYVEDHNLKVRRVTGGPALRLTRDDDPHILNGEVDWVYAEELDVRSNYFWSPDGKRILFLQMDERDVPEYPIVDWIPTRAGLSLQKYPKAGDPNPAVRLGVVDSDGGRVRWLFGDKPRADIYIPRFGWVNEQVAYFQVLNRAQDQLELYFVDVKSRRSQLILREHSDTWIEITNDFRLLKSGDRFLWTSWRDGYTHIYLAAFDKANPLSGGAKLVRQLTKGDWEVLGIEGVDELSGTVYFTANQGNARQRHVYAVSLEGGPVRRISREDGSHLPVFSPDGRYYVDTFSAALIPARLRMCSAAGECQPFWQPQSLESLELIRPEFVDFKAEDGTTLHGTLLLPPAALRREGQRIPLILNPYGGPHGQVSRDAWGGTTFLFHQIMARQGFAILQVDNRGMGARGKRFAAALRRNFGEIEFKDQLSALNQALQRYPFLDPDRIGMWGWSYGGYMTLYAMTHADRFRAGVSVAPVADWLDYDTIYTERYMGLPQENADGYKRASPVHNAANLSGSLLLVHGTSDDNVHLQNSMQMADKLIEAGKHFDLMLYPRKTHGIAGAAARTHLFRRIQQHFERELKGNGK